MHICIADLHCKSALQICNITAVTPEHSFVKVNSNAMQMQSLKTIKSTVRVGLACRTLMTQTVFENFPLNAYCSACRYLLESAVSGWCSHCCWLPCR